MFGFIEVGRGCWMFGFGFLNGCELLLGCWDLNFGSVGDQEVFLIVEL